jgi:hypothetical protein
MKSDPFEISTHPTTLERPEWVVPPQKFLRSSSSSSLAPLVRLLLIVMFVSTYIQ